MKDNNNAYALSLSGGGARGSYEVGAWKALTELGIEIVAVTGTSVGSIVGAFIVQDEFELGLEVIKAMDMDLIFDYEQRGLNRYRETKNLKKMLSTHINEEKMRSSKVDYGLVTVNITDFKQETLFLNDISKGLLLDYILASSNHPLFKRQIINDKQYIDGGLYNNMPTKPLADKGYTNIIEIDIREKLVMTSVPFDRTKCNIITIKSRHDLGGVLNFSSGNIQYMLKLGYLDTMLTFGKYISSFYYVKDTDTSFDIRFTGDDLKSIYSNSLFSEIESKKMFFSNCLKYINTFRDKEDTISIKSTEFFVNCLEICADTLKIELLREYSIEEFYEAIREKIEHISKLKDNHKSKLAKHFSEKITANKFAIDTEDKLLIIATLLNRLEHSKPFYATILQLSPKIAIAYFMAEIITSRQKVNRTEDNENQV